jgi:hypothetical protein
MCFFLRGCQTGADHFKRDDMSKFYNSIKLLGEYFSLARISNGSPINIIGQSLVNLLNIELEKELKNMLHFKTDDFSEIILTQVSVTFGSHAIFQKKNDNFNILKYTILSAVCSQWKSLENAP